MGDLLVIQLEKMKIVAAYLLCVLGGNASPSTADVEKVLTAVGAEADADQIALLAKEMEGKDINEVLEAGKEKLATVSVGGGAAGEPAAEEKKEEVEEEEADLGGGMDMF